MSDNLPVIRIPERSSTYDNLESILKKAKLIRNFGIASFFVFIFLIVYPVFAIIAIVKIGGTDWGNENLNNSKEVFWVTSLCCLIVGLIIWPLVIVPPIMWIVWGNKVKYTYLLKLK